MIVRILMGLVLLAPLSGCKVDPFCISCADEDSGQRGAADGGFIPNSGGSDGGGFFDPRDGGIVVRLPDGGIDMGRTDTEMCNGEDDDEDGEVDEDFDLESNLAHCGACGEACTPPNAFGQCEAGVCYIASCAVGTHDINGGADDGCEYECIPVDVEDLTCDGLDDDCDDSVDEDVAIDTDVTNCGECGNFCIFNNATALCEAGACLFRDCAAGFVDLDGDQFNGCEYACTAAAAELCNGLDDDCDGVIDNGNPEAGSPCGSDKGECTPGTEVCMDGGLVCTGGVNPETEFCDALDNDCDDLVDEFDARADGVCGDAEGSCETGRFQCVNAAIECVGFTGPVDEVCDGFDNDCDATTDENNPDGGAACGTEVGECEFGAELCESGRLVCSGGTTPETEVCDGLDNDCDGDTDENNPDGGRVCGPGTGQCVQGREVCMDGGLVCTGGQGPGNETCNGLDDDCDGSTDEGNPGGGTACGSDVGDCAQGSEICTNGIYVCSGDTGPQDETCDARDNDCDGSTDEGNPEGGKLCGESLGQCVQGVEACVLGAFECQGGVDPVTEVCDGLDNDCDGVIDNGNPGGGTPCGNAQGLCVQGAEVCEGGIYVCRGGVVPADELCDDEDNDCDGSTDEGNPEGGRLCGESLGVCIQGIEVCMAGGFVCQGGVDPVAETCDGLDNDCDGVIDNGNPGGGGSCGNDMGECTSGTLTCQGGVFVCEPGITPIDELCDSLDNDCDGKIDEGDPEGGRLCGDGDGTCVQGREACQGGALVCQGGVGPATEVCDGLDNDCDGAVDNGNPGGGASCGNDMGECTLGVVTCTGGVFVCDPGVVPTDELCDTLDNDCDGSVDEGNPEGGKLCGNSIGTCSPGTQTCSAGSIVCQGSVDPVAETCDGLDNNCDGVVDDGDPGGGDPCGDDTGSCSTGIEECSGGVFICVGAVTPASEQCDGADNDCDGSVDEGNPDSGNLCGSDVGQCSPGVEECMGGGLVCMGATVSVAELCDGLDNNCDGNIDEGNPEGGADCGNVTGECTAGTQTCQGGAIACVGGAQPTAEICDDLDNDCDGSVDETFDKVGDVNHCGACNNLCNLPNAIERCVAGACEVAACDDGWVDIDPDPLDGCDYACSYAGVEVCNGADDDCDQSTDEGLTIPQNFCNLNGVCAGTDASCGGGSGWVCNYPGTYQDVEALCDGLDNDCDGGLDEGFSQLGVLCSNGIGECERVGQQVCNVAGDGTECNAAAAGAEADEECDNLDNDCDGNVDERVVNDPGTAWRDGVDETAISTVMVDRNGGGFMEMMQYEASRPDATTGNAGVVGGYACSEADVIPWTNVTWQEANDACCGLNPGDVCAAPSDVGAWRLCEAPDWTTACEGPSGTCDWSYSSGCDASQPLACNGEEYDCDPGAPFDQDCLLSTGAFPGCGTDWPMSGQVYDLSGNAKEWTASSVASGIYEMRGGSYTSIEAGRTCDFSFVTANENFAHVNTGFRCCFY